MSRISSTFALAAPLACLLIAPSVSAHVELTSPAPRIGGSAQQARLKSGPCGQMANARTETVNEFEPGETITVEFSEFINHPGYFRVAFDLDGDDDFGFRADMDSVDPGTDDPASVDPVGDLVLAYIDDQQAGGDYSVEVTLPNVECDNCTLQLIQFMYDKVGNGMDDEYYYQCADLVLSGEIVGGAGGTDAGGSGGADAGAGGAAAPAGGSDTGGGVGGGSVGAGGAGIATGGAAAGGSTAAAGGTTGLPASGGAVASGGAPSGVGGAGTDADGTDAGMDEDSAAEGGCAFQAPTKPGPLAALLVLFGLVGLLRRRAGA